MSDFTTINLIYSPIQPSEYLPSPRELAQAILGYIPDGTPNTWDEVNSMTWPEPPEKGK